MKMLENFEDFFDAEQINEQKLNRHYTVLNGVKCFFKMSIVDQYSGAPMKIYIHKDTDLSDFRNFTEEEADKVTAAIKKMNKKASVMGESYAKRALRGRTYGYLVVEIAGLEEMMLQGTLEKVFGIKNAKVK